MSTKAKLQEALSDFERELREIEGIAQDERLRVEGALRGLVSNVQQLPNPAPASEPVPAPEPAQAVTEPVAQVTAPEPVGEPEPPAEPEATPDPAPAQPVVPPVGPQTT